MRASNDDSGTSFDRASSRIDLIHHGWMVVVEDFHIVGVLLVVEGYFDIHPSEDVAGRRVAYTLSGVDYFSLHET